MSKGANHHKTSNASIVCLTYGVAMGLCSRIWECSTKRLGRSIKKSLTNKSLAVELWMTGISYQRKRSRGFNRYRCLRKILWFGREYLEFENDGQLDWMVKIFPLKDSVKCLMVRERLLIAAHYLKTAVRHSLMQGAFGAINWKIKRLVGVLKTNWNWDRNLIKTSTREEYSEVGW